MSLLPTRPVASFHCWKATKSPFLAFSSRILILWLLNAICSLVGRVGRLNTANQPQRNENQIGDVISTRTGNPQQNGRGELVGMGLLLVVGSYPAALRTSCAFGGFLFGGGVSLVTGSPLRYACLRGTIVSCPIAGKATMNVVAAAMARNLMRGFYRIFKSPSSPSSTNWHDCSHQGSIRTGCRTGGHIDQKHDRHNDFDCANLIVNLLEPLHLIAMAVLSPNLCGIWNGCGWWWSYWLAHSPISSSSLAI